MLHNLHRRCASRHPPDPVEHGFLHCVAPWKLLLLDDVRDLVEGNLRTSDGAADGAVGAGRRQAVSNHVDAGTLHGGGGGEARLANNDRRCEGKRSAGQHQQKSIRQ